MSEEIEVVCPSCSPKIEVWHDVLKFGQNPVVKCQECGHVHPAKIEIPKPIDVKVIISKAEESFTSSTRIRSDEVLHVDDEIIVDDESRDEVYPIIITSIESGDKRPMAAKPAEIDTIWGRAIDEISIKISVNQKTKTIPVTKKVPGGYEFVVGDQDTVEGKSFVITKIKIRDGDFRERKGDRVEAKYVKRVFAKETYKRGWGEGRTAWSTKERGKGW